VDDLSVELPELSAFFRSNLDQKKENWAKGKMKEEKKK